LTAAAALAALVLYNLLLVLLFPLLLVLLLVRLARGKEDGARWERALGPRPGRARVP
jgi:3-deoxy-D-manno-octulosonic-acid transferase